MFISDLLSVPKPGGIGRHLSHLVGLPGRPRRCVIEPVGDACGLFRDFHKSLLIASVFILIPGSRSSVTSKSPHSEPPRAPFSATERFINNTANATTNVNTAAIQKVSK